MEQHNSGKPFVKQKLCVGCHACAKICAHGAPTFGPDNKATIDTDKCVGCARCLAVCPKDAIQCMYDEAPSILNYKIAEYTKAVVDGRPCFHVSLVMDVSPNCDCHGENDVPIVPNVGMFASFDPVALDQAFGTFVLQGGEDGEQDEDWIEELVGKLRAEFPGHAITLSVGERDGEVYRRWRDAGADRYLLRHETRNEAHYALLHPREMDGARRRECLRTLKALGYQTGAGMMVGSPGQTWDCLLDDIAFLEELEPEMIGMGPFVPAAHTPFARHPAGSVPLTLRLIALMRLRFPEALIPATTALATLDAHGREAGILAGANVVMPNLSPLAVRGQYSIYDHKASGGSEAAEGLHRLEQDLKKIGYHISYGRGDSPGHGGGK